MNKEEIESLFKKYKVRIPKEKQGQSECYECKRHHKYSLTWTSFLYEYEEKYYCFEHIVNILLQQENQKLKKQLENKYSKTGILTNEVLYEENTKLINQQKEFINYLEKKINAYRKAKPFFVEHIHGSYNLMELELNMLKEILANYREIIGGDR